MRLGRGAPAEAAAVKQVQRDLRSLGYLQAGIDGTFGRKTEAAIRALQYDLLHNDGRGRDGAAPVAVREFNRGRVTAVSGVLDAGLGAVIADLLADARYPRIPCSPNPAEENAKVAAAIEALAAPGVPVPFLVAVLKQESGLKHFCEPTASDEDNFVVVGLDRNSTEKDAVTSRGYGAGQFTLFHHPPTPDEVRTVILDPAGNARQAVQELRDKFRRFVNGETPGTAAEERVEEQGRGPLRVCKYEAGDPRHLADCRNCLAAAGTADVLLAPTQYHRREEYRGVPVRRNIGCDWPYAVRRYNGGGINSYHYQAQVLLRVLNG